MWMFIKKWVTSRYIFFLGIIILGLILRFANYGERWGLAYDHARDALIAREILFGRPMPIFGPFSSAGNFTTGPIFFWFLTAITAFFPFVVITPWVMMTLLFTASIILFIDMGLIIGGLPLAIILGLFAAVSPAQIDQGFLLINHSLVALLTTVSVWCGIRYLKTGKTIFGALFALTLGSDISAHYQSILLASFAIPIYLINKPKIKQISLFIILAIIPFIPLVIFDLTHNFYNYRGIIDYILYGQYKIYIPNRWLTYTGIFIPHIFGYIIGGFNFFGYLIMTTIGIVGIFALIEHKINRYIFCLLVSLFLMLISLRYYRGERYESYFVFLHPFILVCFAWACWSAIQKQKVIGLLITGCVIIASLIPTIYSIIHAQNYTALQVKGWIKLLTTKYPGEKYDFYDYHYSGTAKSLPLILFLNQQNLISANGRKIGFGIPEKSEVPFHQEIKENTVGYDLWDLSSSSSAILQKAGWARINPDDIYRGATEWANKLQKTAP
jgi:hypothetical protein